MTVTRCSHCDELTASVEAAHEHALVGLTTPSGNPFDGVVWLSGHLGAVHHVVHPRMRAHQAVTRAALDEQRRVDHRLHRKLRLLEQCLAGDGLATRCSVTGLRSELIELLSEHAAGEHLLLDAFARAIGERAARQLVTDYQRALLVAPTRPHPHLGESTLAEPLLFNTFRLRDRVLDALDSRHVPLPRAHRPRPQGGLWARYLTGGWQPPAPLVKPVRPEAAPNAAEDR